MKEMGYIKYMCTRCADGVRVVSMSCKGTMCLRCGKVYVDEWVSQVSKMLHEGVVYRHIVLTVPEDLRKIFYRGCEKLLGKLMECGVRCLDDYYSEASRKEVKGGYIVVIQTHGRNGQYNPHLHIIATSGGMEERSKEWVQIEYMPYEMLHKKWQWHLMEMMRREIETEEMEDEVDKCYKKYPKGLVANVQKGEVPGRYRSLAKYLAKYVVSPPISVRRIDEYDGKKVRYHYKSHKTERVEEEKVDVYTFIGRMIQHVLPKGFKRIRYYGIQATKTLERVKGIIQEAMKKVKKVVKGAIQIIERKNYRERYQEGTGKDPLKCPHCGEEMDLWMIWHPKYGVIYDEMKEIMSGKYEVKKEEPKKEEKDGRTVRSSPKAVQLSLFSMWN
ncbi:MAG: transposase [Candidatus Brocadiaceae bacterium]